MRIYDWALEDRGNVIYFPPQIFAPLDEAETARLLDQLERSISLPPLVASDKNP